MNLRRVDRLWAAGGVVGAVVLLVVGWFFLISPQDETTATTNAEVAAAQTRLASLRQRLVQLERQNGDLDQYRATLQRDREALPVEPRISDFLRQLQDAGSATGTAVSGMVVGSPARVATTATAYALPVTLTVTGTAVDLGRFLDQLQQVRPRAALVSTVNLVPDTQNAALTGAATLTLGLQVFYAPAAP